MASSSSSSSSSVRRRGSTYDIFLSFRGEDTRYNFVDHLHDALVRKGIRTFKDDQMLGGGKPISQSLLKAIKESKIAVVVFSKNYVNSSWCLEELSEIMECHDQMELKVIPVFYHVDPSDVRKQKGTFDFPLRWHVQEFLLWVCNCIACINCRSAHDGEKNEVSKWREALKAAASISGHHVLHDSGGETAIVDKIVQQILGYMQPRGRETGLVGIESQIERLKSLLRMEATDEVRTIGIFGMGGIGKTTIARALFNRIVYRFEGSSFVSNVRENSSRGNGICSLQERILQDILEAHDRFSIQDPASGAEMIQERLGNKKILLVLDDVDDEKHLEFLVSAHASFGPGSRIMITTRDEHMLSDAKILKYKPTLLRTSQALELFSRHAFKDNSPPNEFRELSNRAIDYTGGLPLALKVLGSFFRGRKEKAWESALDRLAKTPNNEVLKTLKLSFDGLEDLEKMIFLDIACFFKGREVDDVVRVLDCCDYFPGIGIPILIEKSLVTVSENRLDMHDLIQEMGLQVVRHNAPNSRLWKHEEIHDFIKENKNLELVEAIVDPSCSGEFPHRGFSPYVFKSMKNLRLLDVWWHFTSCEPTFLPHELRWLGWAHYPFSSLRVAEMYKLVGLDIRFCNIEHLWEGQKIMRNLKFIFLHNMYQLSRFPDVSEAPNIQSLSLEECRELVEVHESLGLLKRLVYLKMINCTKLKRLPFRIEMKSLETLKLSGCISLERLPDFSECMVKLSSIDLSFCYRLEELPSSIRNVSNLRILKITCCESFINIPDSICELKYLNILKLTGCEKLQKSLDELGNMKNLQELILANTKCFNFHDLPALCFLRKLDLSCNDIRDEDFPTNLGGFSSLEELNLSENSKLIQLPASIFHLSRLKCLKLRYCRQLQGFNGLPSSIEILEATACISLEKIKDPSEEYERLSKIRLNSCKKLLEDIHHKRYLDKMLEKSFLKKWAERDGCLDIAIPGGQIPSWFTKQEVGNKIALKLPPNWLTQIMGFAICGVFDRCPAFISPTVELSFENHGMFVPVLEDDSSSWVEPADDEDRSVWIGYVPFSLLEETMDYDCEGNLVIELLSEGHYHQRKAQRCGAHVVYKDVESTQGSIKPSTSSSCYWNWKLKHQHHKTTVSEFLSQFD